MFKNILLNFFLFFQFSSTNKQPSPHFDHHPEFSEIFHQDTINDLPVNHYDCRERLNVCRLNLNRVDSCSAKQHHVANNKAHVDLYNRAKPKTITAYQCSLSYTKHTKFCGYNANRNHYHDRQSY